MPRKPVFIYQWKLKSLSQEPTRRPTWIPGRSPPLANGNQARDRRLPRGRHRPGPGAGHRGRPHPPPDRPAGPGGRARSCGFGEALDQAAGRGPRDAGADHRPARRVDPHRQHLRRPRRRSSRTTSSAAEIEALIRAQTYSAEYAVSRRHPGVRQAARGGRPSGPADRAGPRSAAGPPTSSTWRSRSSPLLLGAADRSRSADVSEPVVVLANDLMPERDGRVQPADRPRLRHRERRPDQPHGHPGRGAGDPGGGRASAGSCTDVSGGDTVIVDGHKGLLIIDPDEETVARYEEIRVADLQPGRPATSRSADKPAVTRDGARVALLGNIEFAARGRPLPRPRGRGRRAVPDRVPVPEQDRPTRPRRSTTRRTGRCSQTIGPDRPVVIRTLDLGADKFSAVSGRLSGGEEPVPGAAERPPVPAEPATCSRPSCGPSSGPRVHGDVRIMFPMISTVDGAAAVQDAC